MASSSYEIAVLNNSGAAAADYSSYQYYGGYHSAENTITLNAAQGGWCEGPIQNAPESGQTCSLMVEGISQAEAGGVWAVGDPLCVNSSGAFIKALHSSDYVVGRALEVAASSEVHSMMITHEGFGAAFAQPTADGRGAVQTLRTTFDPSATAASRTIAAHSTTVSLPINACVIRSYYYVVTTFTSSTDAATISVGHADDAAGLFAAAAISTGTTFDAIPGFVEGIQDAATIGDASLVTTAERVITFTVAVEALTAGKMHWWFDYVIIG